MNLTPFQMAAVAAGALLVLWPMVGPKLAAFKASLVPPPGHPPKIPAVGHERSSAVLQLLDLQDDIGRTNPKAAALLGQAVVELITGAGR